MKKGSVIQKSFRIEQTVRTGTKKFFNLESGGFFMFKDDPDRVIYSLDAWYLKLKSRAPRTLLIVKEVATA